MANIALVNIKKFDNILFELRESSHNVDCILTKNAQFYEEKQYHVMVIELNFHIDYQIIELINLMKVNGDPEIIILSDNLTDSSMKYIVENNFFEIIKNKDNTQILNKINEAYKFKKQKIKNYFNYDETIFNSYIGTSNEAIRCKQLVYIASKSEIPILIIGNTGTGKEILANIIHNNSNRKNNPLVTVDCAALPEHLSEAILFGSKKGAYTSSLNDTDGLITQSHGGTLFLDEIGELPLSLQKNLLRVLQEKKYRPIGEKNEMVSNFRLICATNKNLSKMVEKGEFRNDLYYRINSMIIAPPVLKERTEDILKLINYYIKKLCNKYNKSIVFPTNDFLEYMQKYNWPGNVRELINTLEICIAKTPGGEFIYGKYLPSHIRYESLKNTVNKNKLDVKINEFHEIPNLKIFRKNVSASAERDYLKNLMMKTNYDLEKICEISGVSRSRLYELMKKFNLHNSKFQSTSSPEFAGCSLASDQPYS
jgi:two-component system, NtrC family, response regulator